MKTISLAIPDSWLLVLRTVREITGVVPILAGGALRDLLNGVEVKDLDIFLPMDADYHVPQVISEFYGALEFETIPNDRDYLTNLGGEGEVQSVSAYRDPSGELPDLNFVFLNPDREHTLEAVASRIDFGICQIVGAVVTGEFAVRATDAFVADMAGQTFTLTRADPHGRSLARFDRLSVKYPGWTLVDGVPFTAPAPADSPVPKSKRKGQ